MRERYAQFFLCYDKLSRGLAVSHPRAHILIDAAVFHKLRGKLYWYTFLCGGPTIWNLLLEEKGNSLQGS